VSRRVQLPKHERQQKERSSSFGEFSSDSDEEVYTLAVNKKKGKGKNAAKEV